ncbi:hypothetical protein FPV67DRAFT_1453373 [Lyophyllum atratum]|nr:hypothetical protein FPV67DRAFT_1453373 [Lyophyllum atratum]
MKLSLVSFLVALASISCASASPQFFTTNSGTDAGTTTCITFTFGDSTSTTVITYTPTPTATTTVRPSPTTTTARETGTSEWTLINIVDGIFYQCTPPTTFRVPEISFLT